MSCNLQRTKQLEAAQVSKKQSEGMDGCDGNLGELLLFSTVNEHR
jgi:hypothetical protein